MRQVHVFILKMITEANAENAILGTIQEPGKETALRFENDVELIQNIHQLLSLAKTVPGTKPPQTPCQPEVHPT